MRSETLHFTSKDGTSIAYERWGSGPPLVLVDGAFCSRRFGPTDDLAPVLARRFTVYAYDRRGRGESGDAASTAVLREVEDLAGLIAVTGAPANVFGMSSGGALALRAAASGIAMTKLAVYEVPYLDDAVTPRPPADLTNRLHGYLSAGDRGGAIKFYMTEVMQMPWLMTLILPVTPNWTPLKASAPSLLHETALMGDFKAPLKQLSLVTTPTLALSGGKSKDMMLRAAKAIAAHVPGARSEVIEGQSHDIKAEALAPVLERFYAS